MSEFKAALSRYKNILGDTKDTIDAIQKFIEKDKNVRLNNEVEEEMPADSVNRILKSIECEETNSEIQKIIETL